MTVIPSLRQLGCKLPVEIMYLGDEDLDEDMRDSLEELDGVVTRAAKPSTTSSDLIDRVVTNRYFGPVLFAAIMARASARLVASAP